MKDVVNGWSAKKHALGKPLYNDKNEKIGSIDDVIITPDKKLSYAVVGTGGFVGLRKPDVARRRPRVRLARAVPLRA
jgi:hypothetical protein